MNPLNLESATRFLALISVIAGILLCTLLPAHGGLLDPRQRTGALSGSLFLYNLRLLDPVDILQNVLLFLPFGFLSSTFVPLGSSPLRRLGWTGLAGIFLSTVLELLQTWIPGRFPSLTDVILNGLGALAGGSLAVRLVREGSTGALLKPGSDAA